jgi:hypothetical protein
MVETHPVERGTRRMVEPHDRRVGILYGRVGTHDRRDGIHARWIGTHDRRDGTHAR